MMGQMTEEKVQEKEAEGSTSKSTSLLYSSRRREQQQLHTLLLLSDSALPLGSFAFSFGLESYLAHQHQPYTPSASPSQQPYHRLTSTAYHLTAYLPLTLSSTASTSLPFLTAAWSSPTRLLEIDDSYDATLSCTVARRASLKQGLAFVGLWERSLRSSSINFQGQERSVDGDSRGGSMGGENEGDIEAYVAALESYATLLRASSTTTSSTISIPSSKPPSFDPEPQGHHAPIHGAIYRILGLDLHETQYAFLFGHARAVVSAAVRAGIVGPYEAQGVLAGRKLGAMVQGLIEQWGGIAGANGADDGVRGHLVEDEGGDDGRWRISWSGQEVPMTDLWGGRHELLYSRVFNS